MTSPTASRRHFSPPRWSVVFAAGLLAAALAGCGSASPDLNTDAAQKLQAKVLTVTQAAAGGDPAGALRSLDDLVAELDASAAEGNVSFKRHQSITKAVEAVRADLNSAKAEADAAAAAAKASADAAAAQAAAAAEAAKAATAPAVEVPAPAQNSTGQGNKGKGKNGD
jgi:hypothetical protein